MTAVTPPVPRLPRWMESAGVAAPVNGVGFVDYWTGVGIPLEVVERSLHMHHAGAADVANDRLASWFGEQHPRAIRVYAETLGGRHRASV